MSNIIQGDGNNHAVDPLTAEAIRHLTPPARRRLNRYIEQLPQFQGMKPPVYRAEASEMPGLQGVVGMKVIPRRGRPVFALNFAGNMKWQEHQLRLHAELPDTILTALRGRGLSQLVDYPLFKDMRISSARSDGAGIIVEIKRQSLVAFESIISTGVDRPLPLLETLHHLGVTQVCRVAAVAIRMLAPDGRQTLMERLVHEERRSGVTDLFSWKPEYLVSMVLAIKDGILEARANLTSGTFRTGCLSIHGSSKTRSRVFSGSMFGCYKMLGSHYLPRSPKSPTMSMEEFGSYL